MITVAYTQDYNIKNKQALSVELLAESLRSVSEAYHPVIHTKQKVSMVTLRGGRDIE